MLPSTRTLALLGFLTCAAMIGGGLYFEHVMALTPCPLCIAQRIAFAATGLVCLLAFLHNPGRSGYKTYTGLMMLFALSGVGLAARQLYLQSLPADLVPACAPPLEFLIETASTSELLRIFLNGTGDCAEVQWSLFGISIPGWSLIAFSAFCLLGVLEFRRAPKIKRLFS